jgi:hypothetical protein
VTPGGQAEKLPVMRRRCTLGLLISIGCSSPKADDTTDETSGDTSSSSETTTTGPMLECPDNPEMCEDDHHDLCDDHGGAPDSLFDHDCCPRPRCDGGSECAEGRVCVQLNLYGTGGPSTLSCAIGDHDRCSCGATLDLAMDARVCVLAEDVPSEPPPLCSTEEIGVAFTIEPAADTMVGTATCTVTDVHINVLELDCTGDFTASPHLQFGDEVDTLPFAIDDEVELAIATDASGDRPQTWFRIAVDGEPAVVVGMGETIVPPGERPPWPTGIAPLEAVEVGCPTVACEPDGPSWTGRWLHASSGRDFAIDVGPGDAAVVPGDFGVLSPVLFVYEGHQANCGPLAAEPEFYTYALIVQK